MKSDITKILNKKFKKNLGKFMIWSSLFSISSIPLNANESDLSTRLSSFSPTYDEKVTVENPHQGKDYAKKLRNKDSVKVYLNIENNKLAENAYSFRINEEGLRVHYKTKPDLAESIDEYKSEEIQKSPNFEIEYVNFSRKGHDGLTGTKWNFSNDEKKENYEKAINRAADKYFKTLE